METTLHVNGYMKMIGELIHIKFKEILWQLNSTPLFYF